MPVGGANPLPQILTIGNSTYNSRIEFLQAAYTSNGGNWLSVSPCNPYGCDTPQPITVSINHASLLPAGTYMGEVVVTQTGTPALSLTVPVTLTIEPSGAFFANLPGAMSFSMPPGAKAVTAQTLQVGDAGSAKLKFAITPSTADGGAWLTVSPASSTAPKSVTVSIVPANLPDAGAVAGTFVGQLLLEAGEDTTTIPVTVTVGAGAFTQLNPLNFVMPVGGANPLPQILTVASINGATVEYLQATYTATDGNWLSVSPCNPYGCDTTYPLTVTVDNASSLPAGTYTGEVTIIQTGSPSMSMTVPVTLSIVSTTKAFFDNLPGETSFSFAPDSKTTPSQTIQIGNGGAGTLDWSVSTSTADTGKWLKVTPTKGANAGSYAVSVTIKSLPNEGKVAGTYLGQQVLKAATGDVTIPVVVTVGNPVFVQLPTVTFNTTQGVNPAPQTIAVDSTGTTMQFVQTAPTGKGGDWLSVSPCNPYGCNTPTNLTVSVNASALAVGTYFAEINVYETTDPAETMTIPVVLNVASSEDETPAATTNGEAH
jgi:hypothetical protein